MSKLVRDFGIFSFPLGLSSHRSRTNIGDVSRTSAVSYVRDGIRKFLGIRKLSQGTDFWKNILPIIRLSERTYQEYLFGIFSAEFALSGHVLTNSLKKIADRRSRSPSLGPYCSRMTERENIISLTSVRKKSDKTCQRLSIDRSQVDRSMGRWTTLDDRWLDSIHFVYLPKNSIVFLALRPRPRDQR